MLKDIKNRLSRHSDYSFDSRQSTASTDRSVQDREKSLPRMPRSSTGRSTSQSTFSFSASIPSSHSASPPPPSSPIPRIQSFTGSLMSCGSDQLLDHSHLKPGDNAALLSYTKTIDMYRKSAKKMKGSAYQNDLAVFLVEAAHRLQQKEEEHCEFDSSSVDEDAFSNVKREADLQSRKYLLEAEKLLKQAAQQGHAESQYYLANMYAAGLLHKKGQDNFDKAFPFFVQAAKHHHADAAYSTAKCYENKLGTQRNYGKAIQYYRKAALLNHPGAMYSLGIAYLHGKLGVSKNARKAHKWLKRSAEQATPLYPDALYDLARLHEGEQGADEIIFTDHAYALDLFERAANLGHAPSANRLGKVYEYGKLGKTPDPTLAIRYYGIAAQQRDPDGCFALTALYLTGADGAFDPREDLAFEWACRAAEGEHVKAEYAVAYFLEHGIGTEIDMNRALAWYQRASEHGDKKATTRLEQWAAEHENQDHQFSRLENGGHAGVHASPSIFTLMQKAKGYLGTRASVHA